MNFTTDNLIVVWYPQYAGGKFIMNCLALSKHCVPLDIDMCNHLLEYPADYDFRLTNVLRTLPSKKAMKGWLSYEFNTDKFYGGIASQTGSQDSAFARILHDGADAATDEFQQRISKLIDKNLDFFAEARGNTSCLFEYLSCWPNAKIIQLINFENFLSTAFLKKTTNKTVPPWYSFCGNECSEQYNLIKGDDWPDWKIFEKYQYDIDKLAKHVSISDDIINEIKLFYPWHNITAPIFAIDVDNTYFDKSKFLTQMKELYSWLGYDDFNETLISTYYEAYIELHIDVGSDNTHPGPIQQRIYAD